MSLYLNDPKRYVIESSREGHNIWRSVQLLLLVPRAGEELLRRDRLEDGQVQEGQLTRQILRSHI